jgi:hypothetical protein
VQDNIIDIDDARSYFSDIGEDDVGAGKVNNAKNRNSSIY